MPRGGGRGGDPKEGVSGRGILSTPRGRGLSFREVVLGEEERPVPPGLGTEGHRGVQKLELKQKELHRVMKR